MSVIGDRIDPPRYRFVRSRQEGKTLELYDSREVDEAFALLGLINAEFQSDPSSVACFDLRIVERVKTCVEKRKTSP